ncbi:UNKNOWN [Stylonychia lemnae]|uniref:VPS9 domain-containing protein n=1 Tax=Stylonychia lemnae TaxID=5949 RepID=A0A078ARP5_STYLE|nr:UNKNOWN [Stylonychia lemnae]|eukprot:CDW85155.1 UNKNOWN [Stylonychia lemnae]
MDQIYNGDSSMKITRNSSLKQHKQTTSTIKPEFIDNNLSDTQQSIMIEIQSQVQQKIHPSQFVFQMAEKISTEPDQKIVEELQRKKQITLAYQAIDEVQAFVQIQMDFIAKMYIQFIRPYDMKILSYDLQKLVIDLIICNEVQNIILFLLRIDNFDADKDMRNKYLLLKGIKTTDFGIDKYLNMSDPITLIEEFSKQSGIEIQTERDLIMNPTVQNIEIEEIHNLEFKEYFKNNMDNIKKLPPQIQKLMLEKSKIKPFKKSVQLFRVIMQNSCSPLQKMFQIQDLLNWQIPNEVREYWKDTIKDEQKLAINRDEYTSIMLFIIVKAQVPDLITQLKFIKEFTSEDIQDHEQNFQICDTFVKFTSPINWICSLEASKLQDKSYLLQANVQIKEEEAVRYDRIRFQDEGDKYDPFSVGGGSILEVNSYLDRKSIIGFTNFE